MHSMTGERRFVAIRVCAAIVALAFAACARQSEDIAISVEPRSQIFGWLQECPTSWASFIKDLRRSGPPVSTFALPERITEVPEFHDCQRFLVGNGSSYGPLVAIFAAWELERLDFRLDSASRTPSRRQGERPTGAASSSSGRDSSGSATVGFAGALIVNLGERYQARNLVIESGFSCLYLWRSGRWNAAIVPVPHDDLCLKPIRPDTFTTAVENLRVIENVVPASRRHDYPPVARWDYDPRTRQQYIGMKCGLAWCEIGSASFNPNPRYPGPFPDPGEAKVVHIKGWYDEQYLAVDSAGMLVPSRLKGTLIPHPRLDTYTFDNFDRIWAPVAYVALDGGTPQDYAHYKAKHNLEQARVGNSLQTLNEIALCRGIEAVCGVPAGSSPKCTSPPEDAAGVRWWGRVRAVSGSVVYKCITREAHENMGFHVPGTARWRWVLKDETTWTRCIEGCCEMDNTLM